MMEDILTTARTWLGVKFHHQGRSRAAGVDCLGLLVKVAEECGLTKDGALLAGYDETTYGHNPDTHYLRAMLSQLLAPIAVSELRPGDVALFAIERRPQHLAIISDYPVVGELGMIHAYAPARHVIEHRLDEGWREKMVGAWRMQ